MEPLLTLNVGYVWEKKSSALVLTLFIKFGSFSQCFEWSFSSNGFRLTNRWSLRTYSWMIPPSLIPNWSISWANNIVYVSKSGSFEGFPAPRLDRDTLHSLNRSFRLIQTLPDGRSQKIGNNLPNSLALAWSIRCLAKYFFLKLSVLDRKWSFIEYPLSDASSATAFQVAWSVGLAFFLCGLL